jgi:hypothetical protein
MSKTGDFFLAIQDELQDEFKREPNEEEINIRAKKVLDQFEIATNSLQEASLSLKYREQLELLVKLMQWKYNLIDLNILSPKIAYA